jgi:hypothetical protein
MNVEDLVIHKKHGRGKIIGFTSFGSRGRYARVRFEIGERLITETRLKPDPIARAPLDKSKIRPTVKDKSIDYDLLERARIFVKNQFPDSDEIKAFPYMYGDQAICEVWKDGHAEMVLYHDIREPAAEAPRRARKRTTRRKKAKA